MAKTRAQKVRAVKQDELRAYVGERNRLDHLFDNIEKIEELNPEEDQYFDKKLQQLKIANEQRIRLLNKYLPDVKEEYAEQTELPPVVIKLTNATDTTAV
tara:strand:+ start:302 stop:601 length:300 start_codon:yes stop_codon:yes gene_type:complete